MSSPAYLLPCRLDHPCPYHPFRYKTDEDAWFVAPNMAERKLAMDMGLPLWGIL